MTSLVSADQGLAITFHDIEIMTKAISQNTAATEQTLGQVLPMTTRPDLLESVILSPVTGAQAETALAGATARLAAHIALSDGLAIISDTIVSTYAIADAALAAEAATLATEGALATTVVVVKLAIDSFGGGFLAEGTISVDESIRQSVGDLVKDPLAFPGDFFKNFQHDWSVDDAWAYSINALQGYLGALGPAYTGLVKGLVWDAGVLGLPLGGKLVDLAKTNPALTQKTLDDRAQSSEQKANRGLTRNAAHDIVPTDLRSLLLSSGQIGTMGGADAAVIRVVTTPGSPPSFTLIIPPTNFQSIMPDGGVGDLEISGGQSALESLSAQALQKAMDSYNETPGLSDAQKASAATSPVMVAGFSQGGITAGAFAQDHCHTYKNIEQVVTIGANVGRYHIPSTVHVLSYVSKDDPIPRLEGTPEPTGPNVQVIYGDDGGRIGSGHSFGFGSHDAGRYAKMAAQSPQQPDATASANLNHFLGSNNSETTITDYYAQ